jgi:putative ABC transport system permease protein
MFRNYITIAFRNIWKHKIFSLINISGLAIGISASLVIFLIVQYDFSFDNHHKDGDRIYRAVSNFEFSGEIYKNSGITSPMADALRKEATGIELVVPFRHLNFDVKSSIHVPGNKEPIVFKKQGDFIATDQSYFTLFSYEWLAGNPAASLQNPYQVVLTVSKAKLYYPDLKPTEVMGKEFFMDDSVRLTISGIVKDQVEKTDFTFRAFLSRATLENTSLKPRDWTQWNNTNSASQLLLKLNKGIKPIQVEKQIAALSEKNRFKEPDDNSKSIFLLQPLNDIHFNTDYWTYENRIAHKPTLLGLLAVALFLLLLGCINFINLTTAQAAGRAKEIGIRKTIGSSKMQLVFQFLNETILITFIATVLSVLITPLLLKVFSDFIPSDLSFNFFQQPALWVFLLLLILVVSLLSGFYPALVLSGFKPIAVLKSQSAISGGQSKTAWLRKSLTVAQFVIAQVFIIAAFFVSKQINYTLQKDLGFQKEAILLFNTHYNDTAVSRQKLLVEKIMQIPEVAMVSLSTSPPSSASTWSGTVKYKNGKNEIETDVQFKYGDTNYLKLFKMTLLAGTGLQHSDTVTHFVINETYARLLGFLKPQDAIGKMLMWDIKPVPITGVVRDFHTRSLHEQIKPTAIGTWASASHNFNVALHPQNGETGTWQSAIKKIENSWKELYPENEFEYSFLDENIAKFYTSEKNISRLLYWATGLAIFISCLGLLGLVMFITNQRTKEIGIRKVIGATVTQIVSLLTKDFLKLVLIGFLIAVPIAWWGTNMWLENFAFKTTMSWWIFLISGMLMIIIALITLGLQTIRSAMANPVKSLRSE